MQDRVILISDDTDFFEYMVQKLTLRKSDEIYRFSFDEIPEKLHLFGISLILINAENRKEKTLDLLNLLNETPAIIFTYNYDNEFSKKAYQLGAFDYLTIETSDSEIDSKLMPALSMLSSLRKNNMYRELLVNNNLISKNSEVYTDYCNILDKEISYLEDHTADAVFCAISPSDKSKFLVQPSQIEEAILNNIRKNDILMRYGINKYFLLLFNTNIEYATKIWNKIQNSLPQKIYAGFVNAAKKKRQQLVNDALNKLHEEINKDSISNKPVSDSTIIGNNFKLYKHEFNKKIENVIAPVFYMFQQNYNNKLFGMTITQSTGDGYGALHINGKYSKGSFRISSPGLSRINIDISYDINLNKTCNDNKIPESKRISLEPEELETGLLEDLLEQFIIEFKSEVNNECFG